MKSRTLTILITLSYFLPINAQIVTINKESDDCYLTFVIDKNIESDIFFQQQLSCYIYNAMIDNSCKLDSLFIQELYKRTSFKESLIYLLDDNNNYLLDVFYEKNNDCHGRWAEYSVNLLYNCTNYDVKCDLVNELLKCNNDKGVIAMWEDIDPQKLPCLPKYIKYNIKNKNCYLLAELACTLYNSKSLKLYNYLIKEIAKQDVMIAEKLTSLTKSKYHIEYIEYIDYMYN